MTTCIQFKKIYRNPTPDNGDTLLTEKWSPVKPHAIGDENFELNYLNIGNEIKMETNPDAERISFWKSIYNKYNGSYLKPKL